MDSSSAPSSPSSAAPQASSSPASSNPAAPSDAQSPKSSIQAVADGKKPDAAPPAETKAEKKARLLKLKVDGKEEQIDLDAMSDEDLTRDLQLSRAARVRMQEAAAEKKRIQEALEYGKSNVAEALKSLGLVEDPKAWAEQYLTEQYGNEAKQAAMTPEQKRIAELEAEKAAWEKSQADLKAKREAKAKAEFDKRVETDLLDTFGKVFQTAGVPKNPKTMYEAARLMKLNLEHGIKLTPEQIVSELKQQRSASVKDVLASLEGDGLLAELGDETAKKVIKAYIAKSKVVVPKPVEEPKEPSSSEDVPDHLKNIPWRLRKFYNK